MVNLQESGNTGGKASSRPAGKRLTVLIVDDNPDMRAYVRHCLRELDNQIAQTHEAADGLMALNLARSIQPNLVISDIMMPGLDGYELCKALKTLPLDSKPMVLLISGETDEQRIREAGADAFLDKPFNAERMRKSLNQLLCQS